MMTTISTEIRTGKHYLDAGRDRSPRFIHSRREQAITDSVIISDEARDRMTMERESPLVRALSRLSPGIAKLAGEAERSWDSERTAKVNALKAGLREGTYDLDRRINATDPGL